MNKVMLCSMCGENCPQNGPNQKYCAKCKVIACKEKSKQRDARRTERRRAKKAASNLIKTITCAICGIECVRTGTKQKYCQECKREGDRRQAKIQNQKYMEKNRDKVLAQKRESYKANREKYRKEWKKYYEKNAEALGEKKKEYKSREDVKARAREILNWRLKNDTRFALNHRMRTRIYQALRSKKKGRRWARELSYTLSELMDHLEKKFQPGMTWDNMSEWHVDHIKPIAAFEFASAATDGFRQCWDLENLQPLWAEDNWKKGARLDWTPDEISKRHASIEIGELFGVDGAGEEAGRDEDSS